mmetsp:Transcript_128883/g.287252  ORF Transcript_128883/g.287252 Transcript_128883/m.287252 type:complete len:363 (-) Transcript_128883:907-1995(-)
MPLVREQEELVRLLRSDERVDEARSVAEVDIFVDKAVDKEEVAPDAADVLHDGAALVALGVALRRAHVSLGVASVVAIPTRHRRSRHGALEDVSSLCEAHGAQVTTVAPAVNGHARAVGKALAHAPAYAGRLVVHLHGAHVVFDGCFETQASAIAAAAIHLEHQAAAAPHGLGPQVHSHHPRVRHELHMRTPVARDHHGVGPWPEGFGVRTVEGCLQFHLSVGGREGHKLWRLQPQLGDQGVLVSEDAVQLPAILEGAQCGHCRLACGAADVDEGPRGEIYRSPVHAGLCGHLHRSVTTSKGDAEEVPLQPLPWACATEVDHANLLVHCCHILYLPVAARQRPEFTTIEDVEVAVAGALARP